MSRNIAPGEEHLNRKDNFRFEEAVTDLTEALEKASARSLQTYRTITVMQAEATGIYTIHSHGVGIIGTKIIAHYHRGIKK